MNDRERAVLATLWISSSRTRGDGVSDERNVIRAGFRDLNEYWAVVLSDREPIPRSSFIDILSRHFFEPTLVEGGAGYQRALRSAADFANIVGEASFINTPGEEEPLVRPRQMAECLLAMPKRAHLVPPSLKAFLKGAKGATAATRVPAIPKPKLPKEELKLIMEQVKAEFGKAPSMNEVETFARKKFPTHRVSRDDVRSVHKRLFGPLPSGRRPKNCAT